MFYIYYDETHKAVTIVTQKNDERGVLVGSVSPEDFEATDHNFLIHSLLRNAGINTTGVTIIRDVDSTL